MSSGDKVEQIRLIDPDTGEVELDITRIKKKDQLGRDWVAMYQKPMEQIIEEVPNFGTMKVLLYLMTKIDYEGKFEAPKSYIAKQLKIERSHVHKCLKWLEENNYIQAVPNEKGAFDFYINPDIVMKGNKKTHAVEGWVKRANIDVKSKGNKVVYSFNN